MGVEEPLDDDDEPYGPDSYSPFVKGSEYKGGIGHGHAKRVMNCGQQFDGQWKDDHEHGNGHLTCDSGSSYNGGWEEGKRHGEGTHAWPSGAQYEGQWTGDRKEGKGKITLASGNTYDGEWKANQRHGWGVFKVAKPNIGGLAVYEGEWYKDSMSGRGTTRCFDGALEISRYESNRRVGEGVRWVDAATLKKKADGTIQPPVGASETDYSGPWRLKDGLEVEVIDAATAASIAAALELPVPKFPFHEG